MKGKDLAIKYKTLLSKYGINTPVRLAYFFGQLHHESGNFKLQRESLNYSVSGLLTTFSRNRISEVDANKYGRTLTQPANQVAIANILYGGEFGKKQLGNVKKEDGYLFRGGGFIQITGRANYQELIYQQAIIYKQKASVLNTPRKKTFYNSCSRLLF